jgi:RNA polymerase sigma-70 factor (ECF subfamily)
LTAIDAGRMHRARVDPDADTAALLASRTEPDRFAALFDRYHPDIRRYAASRLGGELADDVAADTFLIAFRTRHKYRSGGGNVRAWLFGIATNLIRRQHRDEERRYRALARAGAVAERDPGDDGTVSRVTADAVRPALAEALAALTANDRDALLLTAVAQLEYAEVAAALGVPAGTVGSRLNRARKSIRAALGDADPTGIDEGA